MISMEFSAESLSKLGVSDRYISAISKQLGSDFRLRPEELDVLSELDLPLERLMKPIIQSDDFSSKHPFFDFCVDFSPKAILSYQGDDVPASTLEELILREPVYALQREINKIPSSLFSQLVKIEPKATLHFAKSRLQEEDIVRYCQELPEIAIRYMPEKFGDDDLLRLAEISPVLAYEYAQERCIYLGIDFSTLHHGREFELVVEEFPSLKIPAMEKTYIARLLCDNCGQNSIMGDACSLYDDENGSKFELWDCTCVSCGSSTTIRFNIVVESPS